MSNLPSSQECFVCARCDTPLAGQKFASREDKPFCADCFAELFAKRCASCDKPITGQGGTRWVLYMCQTHHSLHPSCCRFISFEGRHWHSQCFICVLCKQSMAGKGFITDGEDIICPECAKDKLCGPN